ncbi:MAG: nucleotidyltransferase domain-containing protein [Armatimonadota bacterium]|nr:nucleotidyltransferase domain-containing protein [Armatimonadota bacterium]MDR7451428.1 nucleotidyltransferase domain-containing protein [Armatimonadota bacterium]MDR7466422.1 nucleotidyltransferase domain-containing protein [Armatimonadota bacterium]MDR7493144.1 nucleotidyltransferase domain-containing protein [Armatimonadota bacterium]MDR7500333.1 nucleotidyltransferase domain-containing protein [Armatimonadota bacterium]
MNALTALRSFFAREAEVVAVYLYGKYATDRTWPDSDLEVALVFPERYTEEEIAAYMERLSAANPLGEVPGILMPFALNTHIVPVIYEILTGGTLLVNNDPAAHEAFTAQAMARLERERGALLDEAREMIQQARSLGVVILGMPGPMLPQPPRYLDPIRIGWRLSRILSSAAVLEPTTREAETAGRDPERLGQIIGWFSNAAGAATGIAKAMLNIFDMPRPARRWEVFLPLADVHLLTTELALQLAAAVESRWQLLTGAGLAVPERIVATVRTSLAPIVTFARLAAWYCELPGGRTDQRLH